MLWHGQWYRYLTNVLDPEHLSARQVCELYRRRWRIEDAFLLTKRVLDLAYLWTASPNGIQLQIFATLIFYAVLLNLCQQVAQALQRAAGADLGRDGLSGLLPLQSRCAAGRD